MKLSHVCLITDNLERLKKFYQDILQLSPREFEGDYVEFPTEGAILSLFDLASHEKLAPGTMRARANHSVEVEFQVKDVDQEYARLKKLQWPIVWIMPPTTLPWGNRSIYFRDPDGNFLNFFSVAGPP
jgi:catechol 2,3-dioxygenase-like lactoylglutathione lyase family enzyme